MKLAQLLKGLGETTYRLGREVEVGQGVQLDEQTLESFADFFVFGILSLRGLVKSNKGELLVG